MARVVRVVVEVGAPDGVTERDLARKLREILKWPIQLGRPGDRELLLRPEVKWFSRVAAAEKRRSGVIPIAIPEADV